MLQILGYALAKCIEPLLKRAELLLQHQYTLIRLRRLVAFPQDHEKNRQDADQRNRDKKVKRRGHLFVMSSGVETSLNISETVSIELVRHPTLSPLPSRRNRSCRSSRALHSSTSLGMTSDHQYFDAQNRTFIPA